jgi:uncharacterized BrkB/YihY/UPF0761 family membrane protein
VPGGSAIKDIGLLPVRFVYDLIVRFIEDDGLASAGYLAYIGLMTLLPFIVFLFTLLGLVGQADYGETLVRYMFDLCRRRWRSLLKRRSAKSWGMRARAC